MVDGLIGHCGDVSIGLLTASVASTGCGVKVFSGQCRTGCCWAPLELAHGYPSVRVLTALVVLLLAPLEVVQSASFN